MDDNKLCAEKVNNDEKILLSVKDLTFRYRNNTILDKVNFNIYKGKNVAILGRNGGGKSTLIKVILGFLNKSSGEIKFSIDSSRIGYLPQIREFDTSFPINIFDLVISGITSKNSLFRKFSKGEMKKADMLLNEFGINHLKDRHISEVSGGQLQRALIARALISSPEILFLDEPESFLDKEFEFKLFDKIRELSDSTLVVISHELDNFCHHVNSVFIVEGNVKIYKDKEDFFKSKDSYRHVHKH